MCQYIVLPRRLSHSAAFSIKPDPITTLWFQLHSVPDHRRAQGRRYPLPIVLVLAILAICSGQGAYQAMSEWVENYQDVLKEQVSWLSGHLPDGSTFYRILSGLDVTSLEEVFAHWIGRLAGTQEGEGIALDGKTVGGSGLHLVAAFAHQMRSVLYEKGTDTKGKELVVGPRVLDKINLSGRVVTADALFAQTKICQQITLAGGGYVIAVKGNQENLEQSIKLLFEDPSWGVEFQTNKQLDAHKGRVEERFIEVSNELNDYLDWPGLTHVWRVTSKVNSKKGTTTAVRVGIARLLTKDDPAGQIAKYVRGHWGIENRLHRQRDKLFNEDKCGIRKRAGPQVMVALRNLVTTIFYQASARSFASVFRRFSAKPEELLDFLGLTQVNYA